MKRRSGQTADGAPRFHGYRPFLLVVLFFSFYLSYLILYPFLDTLIMSIVISSLFYPLQTWLVRLYRGRQTLAALTIVFILTFVIAIPVFFFASTIIAQGVQTINQINDWIRAGNIQKLSQDPRVMEYLDWVQTRLSFLDLKKIDISSDIMALSKNFGQFVLSRVATIVGNVASLVTHFFILVFISFYLVRDGAAMLEAGRSLSPLRKDQEDRLLDGIRVVARSVLMGAFATALCQGLVGGIGVAIIGLPGLFWGTVMGFASFIPIVGTALVWLPMALYLVLLGTWKSALFLALWCIILLGSIDNFVRPYLMQGQSNLSPFYIFLSIIGGVQYFGLTGILYGPLILSFAMIMLYIYGAEYREDLDESKSSMMEMEEEDSAGTQVSPSAGE
jgi:predicted PurR-regulated permease PerM